MKPRSLIFRFGPEDRTKVTLMRPDSVETGINWCDLAGRFDFGLEPLFKQLSDLGLKPSERAIDLVLLAAAVTAADTRVARATASQDAWTREIALYLPVKDPELWNAAAPELKRLLDFLTGDRWALRFRPRPAPKAALAVNSARLPMVTPTCVCLFSGGLDSFIGAVDLLSKGETPVLVSHYADGPASTSQAYCFDRLEQHIRKTTLKTVRARVAFPSDLVNAGGSETTLRGRSFLFFAMASLVASTFDRPMTIYVPENGFISLNVPLDALRLGALSTRTTHPFYMARWQSLLAMLGINAQLVNPYRFKTKGQMIRECADKGFLQMHAKSTASCLSMGKARWKGKGPRHCGYCVPCLIRRAAMLAGFGSDETVYEVSNLRAKTLNSASARGDHVRSFQFSIWRLRKKPASAKILIHQAGPLSDYPSDLPSYEAVYVAGLREVEQLLQGVKARPL